ncbi:hypothetical protein CR513_46030, partial [Mucuna pruriens]
MIASAKVLLILLFKGLTNKSQDLGQRCKRLSKSRKTKVQVVSMGRTMIGSTTKVALIVLVIFAITIPCLEAGIGQIDDFLKAQANEAHKVAVETYIPMDKSDQDTLLALENQSVNDIDQSLNNVENKFLRK